MTAVVEVRELSKRYGATVAVDDVSFEVGEGEIFGMVGPNGAGKTTTIECLEGLRRPDSGTVRVLGMVPGRNGRELEERIGVQLQESNLSPRIRVWEALELFSAFYRRSTPIDGLLERLDLGAKRKAYFGDLSGGQKQRLFIALALVNDPELVFLDELTTGLDPHARRSMWDLVRNVRDGGKTVVLTTHFMEEAERLCDRVAIVDRGRIVALDSPAAMVASLDAERRLVVTTPRPPDPAALEGLPGVSRVESRGERLTIEGRGADLASRVLARLVELEVEIRDLTTEQASLEDVFLALTGRPLEAPGSDGASDPDGAGGATEVPS